MLPIFRPIKTADLQNIARVFVASLNQRHLETGLAPIVDLSDETAWNTMWEAERRPLFEHVSAHAAVGWLAEDDGEVLGYARSIQRDDVCQLTDFFVLPGRQHAGLGRELLSRAFEQVESPSRLILANSNPAALSRYMRAGVYPMCTIFDFERKARPVSVETDLEVGSLPSEAEELEALNQIDKSLLGYTRPQEHTWLAEQRSRLMFFRNGTPAGYGYAGRWSGPLAALDDNDMPAIMAQIETNAAKSDATFGVMVPLANRTAMTYLIDQGFHLDTGHTMYFMADFTPPGLDRYILSMPGFFT
ncbi:MAG: GNAT family N-acetyltransferase [Alphaproteobacteria bacterium]|nr:GNAT family N-acetyltransferase [Alphaproteobacteria bacterium]